MIRRAQAGDRPALEAIYDICFPGEISFREWIFMHVWSPQNCLVFELDGKVQSMVMDLPTELTFEGKNLAAHYIYAAATLPEARGKGMMNGLLRRTFDDGVSRGQHFSTLITQNDSLFDFYAPLGFETVSAVRRFSIAHSPLGGSLILRPAVSADLDAMADIYRRETAGTLAFSRGRDHFEQMLDLYGKNLVVLVDGKADVKAYAFIEDWHEFPIVSEIFGMQKLTLARTLCNQLSAKTVFQDIAPVYPAQGAFRLGCVKPLTDIGKNVLNSLKTPPYFNIMYN